MQNLKSRNKSKILKFNNMRGERWMASSWTQIRKKGIMQFSSSTAYMSEELQKGRYSTHGF